MPLIAQILEDQFNNLVQQAAAEPMSSEDYNRELAQIITDYIKTAQVTVNGSGTGANGGGPIATFVTGTGTIS